MIEQILAFVLGAGSVFLIWGVVVAFRTSRKLKSVQEELPNIYLRITEMDEQLNRRIDQEVDRVDGLHRESVKHTDSRVDKLDSKLEAKFNDVFSYDESKTFELSSKAQQFFFPPWYMLKSVIWSISL